MSSQGLPDSPEPTMQDMALGHSRRTTTITTSTPVQTVEWGPTVRTTATLAARHSHQNRYPNIQLNFHVAPGTNPFRYEETPFILRSADHSSSIPTSNIASPATSPILTTSLAHILGPPRPLRPPPPTPPNPTLHSSLSMPTVPHMHPSSSPLLVDSLTAERALDPVKFDLITRAIKASLIAAKIERGGDPELLTEEYTVELASRLDAERSQNYMMQTQPFWTRLGTDISDSDPEEGSHADEHSHHTGTVRPEPTQAFKITESGTMTHASTTSKSYSDGKEVIVKKTVIEVTETSEAVCVEAPIPDGAAERPKEEDDEEVAEVDEIRRVLKLALKAVNQPK